MACTLAAVPAFDDAPSRDQRAMRAIVAHCWTGTPASGWYPALAAELSARGFGVAIPALPDTDAPSPAAWRQAVAQAVGGVDGGVVVIGHSLGALAAVQWLAGQDARIAALVLVAPPAGDTALEVVRRFAVCDDTIARALDHAERSVVVVSDRDPYLLPSPRAVAARFTRAGAEAFVLPGNAHFSPASGVSPLPAMGPVLDQLGRMVSGRPGGSVALGSP